MSKHYPNYSNYLYILLSILIRELLCFLLISLERNIHLGFNTNISHNLVFYKYYKSLVLVELFLLNIRFKAGNSYLFNLTILIFNFKSLLRIA
ncbi:hypothetical protein QE390_001201 [Siphonobacter sp. SORGH_AS 1065]|nr:hypothetical protein [Siphonobacter sp. SORGH_AS_1065]